MPTKRTGVTASKTYVDQSVSRLHGILCGMAADCILKDAEIGYLQQWLVQNDFLTQHEPFKELSELLNQCLADQIIDHDEREEIIDWCVNFTAADSWKNEIQTEAIRRLHGFLNGIISDGKIEDKEIIGMKDWLYDYEIFKEVWPFLDAWALVTKILKDGIVDDKERAELFKFCEDFTGNPTDAPLFDPIYKAGFMKNGSPATTPFTSLCSKNVKISFEGCFFCFTGPAKSGKRANLQDGVIRAGGIPTDRINWDLDYLVIGSRSSPAWVYTTYGRKIEKAISLQQEGGKTIMLMEDDFMPQLKQKISVVI